MFIKRVMTTGMPDWLGLEDDDETIGPWYNDTGDFGPGYIEEDDE